MTVQGLIDSGIFAVVNVGREPNSEITKPFCCDLLSIAMGRAPEGCAWVTVMSNINTLAVASLVDAACVIIAENAVLDDVAQTKMSREGITVLKTEEPIFEAALAVWKLLHGQV